SNEFSPKHHFTIPGTYVVNLKAITEKGCVDSTASVVVVEEPFTIWVPNAFTPNADYINDRFTPVMQNVSDYTMEIYDRWGLKIFTTTDQSIGWDAYINGEPA